MLCEQCGQRKAISVFRGSFKVRADDGHTLCAQCWRDQQESERQARGGRMVDRPKQGKRPNFWKYKDNN